MGLDVPAVETGPCLESVEAVRIRSVYLWSVAAKSVWDIFD